MARARNIKPAFFKNADLAETAYESRLLFAGLWTLADREGRLLDRPKQIKMEIFPADNVDVDVCLNQLAEHGFIKRYTADGKKIIQVVNFAKHQTPHSKEADSELPDEHGVYTVQVRTNSGFVLGKNSESTRQAPDSPSASTVKTPCEHPLIPDSLNLIPDSGLLNPDCGLLNQKQTARKRSPSRSVAAPVVDLPTWIPDELWEAFCQMRKQIKKPLSQTAAELALSTLAKLKEDGHEPAEALRNSILNSWAGIFPPNRGITAKPASLMDHNRAASEEAKRKLFGEMQEGMVYDAQ